MRAACAGHPRPDSWFPEHGSFDHHQVEAKAICRGCPVQQACAAHADRYPEHGIWGGQYQSSKRATLAYRSPISQSAVEPCGTSAAYQRHIRHGETPCDACRQAVNTDRRNRRAAKHTYQQAKAADR